MKKLAYIILVIAILVIISYFVKQSDTTTVPVAEEAIATTETLETTIAVENTEAATENSEITTAPAEDNDVVDIHEDIVIEDTAPQEEDIIEVEETNPSETADEDETIIQE